MLIMNHIKTLTLARMALRMNHIKTLTLARMALSLYHINSVTPVGWHKQAPLSKRTRGSFLLCKN